jgi:glyceraldehyde-3-phosphate dehydrogenase (ferredoxin)
MGKYYVYYEVEYLPPEELGRKNVERMTYELFNDNSGICRFHRKWAEVITDEILVAHYDLKVDYKTHQFELARAIFEQEKEKAVPWESARIADLIMGFLHQMERDGFSHPDLKDWLHRFAEDKVTAARDYWERIHDGIARAFAEGPDAIQNKLSPGQSGGLNL